MAYRSEMENTTLTWSWEAIEWRKKKKKKKKTKENCSYDELVAPTADGKVKYILSNNDNTEAMLQHIKYLNFSVSHYKR